MTSKKSVNTEFKVVLLYFCDPVYNSFLKTLAQLLTVDNVFTLGEDLELVHSYHEAAPCVVYRDINKIPEVNQIIGDRYFKKNNNVIFNGDNQMYIFNSLSELTVLFDALTYRSDIFYDDLVRTQKNNNALNSPPQQAENITKSLFFTGNQHSAHSLSNINTEIDENRSINKLREYKMKISSKPGYCKAMEKVVMESLGYKLDGQIETRNIKTEFLWRKEGTARKLDKKSVTGKLKILLAELCFAQGAPTTKILEEFYNQYLQIIGKEPKATPVFQVPAGYRLGEVLRLRGAWQ